MLLSQIHLDMSGCSINCERGQFEEHSKIMKNVRKNSIYLHKTIFAKKNIGGDSAWRMQMFGGGGDDCGSSGGR